MQREVSIMYRMYRIFIEHKEYTHAQNIYEQYLSTVPQSMLDCAIYDYVCDSIAE